MNYVRPECVTNLRKAGCARRYNFTGDDVCVDHGHTEFAEEPGNRRFAAGDATGEADDEFT